MQALNACFNGATAMKSWKRRGVPFHVERNRPMLKWGHGDEAVEEGPRDELSVGRLTASMGPRR